MSTGVFLDALDDGHVVATAFMKELSADDDAVFEDVLAGTAHSTDAALYDVERLRRAVERDRELLRALADEAGNDHTGSGPKATGAGRRAGGDRGAGRARGDRRRRRGAEAQRCWCSPSSRTPSCGFGIS